MSITEIMETNQSNANNMNNTYIGKNNASKVNDIKNSSSMLNNFSVERILSETTQPSNQIRSNLSNGLSNQYAHLKRRLLDENIPNDFLNSERCTRDTKQLGFPPSIDSSVKNNFEFSGKPNVA